MSKVVPIRARLPREVPKCLHKLTEHAHIGKIVTIAFIAVTPNGYMADVCGDDHVTPDMLIELQRKILRKQSR